MPQSRAKTNSPLYQRQRKRSTTKWRRWPYLSKLWRPNKNIPQRHNQFLFGDAMGVVRRLEEVMGKQELKISRGSVSAQILHIFQIDWNSNKNQICQVTANKKMQ